MSEPRRVCTGLLAVLMIVVTGCGSTETTSTTAKVSAPATTSAATTAGSQTVTLGTGRTGVKVAESNKATTEGQEKAAEVGTKTTGGAPKPSTQAGKRPEAGNQPVPKVPKLRQYEPGTQHKFIASCTSKKGSTSSCECIVARFELTNVTKVQSFAEVIALEYVLLHNQPVSPTARKIIAQCKGPLP
jgi:hypothetical protein